MPDYPDLLGRTNWYYELHQVRLHLVLKLLERIAPVKAQVLEVGVWPGYLALGAHEKGYSVEGLDLEPERLPAAVTKILPIYKFDLNQGEVWPMGSNRYDCIVASEIIEHLDPRKLPAIFTELSRVIKTGGCLVLTTPNKWQLGNIVRGNLHREPAKISGGHGHWREYGKSELRQLLGHEWKIKTINLINFYSLVGRNRDGTYYYPIFALTKTDSPWRNLIKLLSSPIRVLPCCRDSMILVAQKI